MKKKGIDLKNSLEKLESEVRLYNDLDALIKSYREVDGLSEKDIISVLERIKFQILLDSISSQSGIKDKLDQFTRKWNLFSKEEKESDTLKLGEGKTSTKIEKTDIPGTDAVTVNVDEVKKKKKRFQLRAKKKDSDKFFNKMKRQFKVSRCENCGYFYVHDAEKGIFQCTFFEFSSEVDKKDVCENWTDTKKFKQSFF